jgi:hypothetical protein
MTPAPPKVAACVLEYEIGYGMDFDFLAVYFDERGLPRRWRSGRVRGGFRG